VPEFQFCGEYWAMPEWLIGQHQHEVWEFYAQVAGESDWDGQGRTYRLRPGGFLAVAPGVRHAMHERPRTKHHFYYAALDLPAVLRRQPELKAPWFGQRLVFEPRAESVAAPFRQLLREVTLALPHRAAGLRLALDSLVLEATRVLCRQGGGDSHIAAHPAVIQAKELLEHQCHRAWTLAALGQVCGMSPTHLAELFTRDVGVPPRQYLLQARIERAKHYLAQRSVPITALGLELGFSSSQHFAATFKRITGQTPREFIRKSKRR
jgi:AraC-like DNA-binding protein